MNIQGGQTDQNGKGILTKIFKNQHAHARQHGFHGQQQNYVDHMNQTHGQMAFQTRGGPSHIIKSPNGNIREHLHT